MLRIYAFLLAISLTLGANVQCTLPFFTYVPNDVAVTTPAGELQIRSTGDADLDKATDAILDRLLTAEMTLDERIEEIYAWTKRQISYTSPAKTTFIEGAMDGLTYRRGNCYTRAFTLLALLTRAGVEATYEVEYEGRHAWVVYNGCILDTGFSVFMVPEEELQDYVHAGFYLYATTERTAPGGSIEHRTEYIYKEIPFNTVYQLNPDETSFYPEHVVAVEGQVGSMRDQWTRYYEYGVYQPKLNRDILVAENVVIRDAIDRVILVGQYWRQSTLISVPKTVSYVNTNDRELDGKQVPGTGIPGEHTELRRLTSLDERGYALDYVIVEVSEIAPIARQLYRFVD